MQKSRPKIVAVVGPTAVGKSALAFDLARRGTLDLGSPGEIVSADSRQVYRELDIGTAKPTLAERREVPHHVVDVVDPEDDFSLADFQDHAYAAIDGILVRGGVPLLVGGTGLYVKSVVEGVNLPRVAPDPELRAELELIALTSGYEGLHGRLAEQDPLAAARIDPRNVRRVIRALEVVLKSGRPFSDGSIPHPRYEVLTIGLTTDRATLYRAIDERVEAQMAAGLLDETRRVLDRGCPPDRPAINGFGYRELQAHVRGEIDLATAIERYKFETHRFARQQENWFRRDDPKIHWIPRGPAAYDEACRLVRRFLESDPGEIRGGKREVLQNAGHG